MNPAIHNVAQRVRGAEVTTFRLGGTRAYFADTRTVSDAREALREAHARGLPVLVLGGGSNLLISDEGFAGEVVRFLSPADAIRRFGDVVEASAGVGLDALALFCVAEGLDGLLFASGIPGTVGGAIVGNAGAFGESVADRLVSVRLFHPARGAREIPRGALRFSYRRSSLADAGELVESARFLLRPADPSRLREERERLLQWRRERHPDWNLIPCAGSVFRNVEPTCAAERRRAAGWFLEQAGAKALRVGGAAVYEKHANIIVKRTSQCTAQDVYALSRLMADAVRRAFDLDLHREVRLIGRFDPPPDQPMAP
jgi:UDP-N-acetylmuramate dehydrogenase